MGFPARPARDLRVCDAGRAHRHGRRWRARVSCARPAAGTLGERAFPRARPRHDSEHETAATEVLEQRRRHSPQPGAARARGADDPEATQRRVRQLARLLPAGLPHVRRRPRGRLLLEGRALECLRDLRTGIHRADDMVQPALRQTRHAARRLCALCRRRRSEVARLSTGQHVDHSHRSDRERAKLDRARFDRAIDGRRHLRRRRMAPRPASRGHGRRLAVLDPENRRFASPFS